MSERIPEETSDALLALGELALKFAAVNRVTFLMDGKTPESDTDHTVMLGLLACALASAHKPQLDIGKVAQFALVHDLVEVYAGDTDTFGMTSAAHRETKDAREAEALKRIQKEFDATLPWISKTIIEYESLASEEARFIQTLDKTLPKITRIKNNDANLTAPEAFDEFCKKQIVLMRDSYGKDQEEACSFYEYLHKKALGIIQAKQLK